MKTVRALLAPLLLIACAASAWAGPFSTTPMKLVVGFAPGGAVDVVCRILASRLSERLESTIIVENKPGFSGNLGTQEVAKAAADGKTLLMAPVTSYAVTPLRQTSCRFPDLH